MEIIRSLEKGRRGVYCGALGYISPKGYAAFSVPIRTLQKENRARCWKYRVGSGIVWDSKASEERRECVTKCGFLNTASPEFEIFESLLWDKIFLYFRDHIERFKSSASYFNYPFDASRLASVTTLIKKALRSATPQKTRIFLNKNGDFRWDCSPVHGPVFHGPVPALFSDESIDEQSPFLFNKTTYKPWYISDKIKIQQGRCFDVIHVNSQKKITEGSRCNVFIKKGDMLFTPPVECGLLPGVLRKNLLRRKKCKETVLTFSDLKRADAVYCGNSVRGLVEVTIEK